MFGVRTRRARASGASAATSERIKFQTKGSADVRMQTGTFDAGGRGGWHHHPGMVIVAVETGTLTALDADRNRAT